MMESIGIANHAYDVGDDVNDTNGRIGFGIGRRIMAGWRATDAKPGTEDKIQVMHERARLNQPLFHPKDAIWSIK